MPILTNVRVLNSLQVWASPDGQRKIFDVTFVDPNNQTVTAKSYSEKLTNGWSGDVETYEKANRTGGMDTFVKQAPKADAPYGGGFGGGSKGGGGKFGGDPFAMYLSYAKDLAVAMLKEGDLDEDKYAKVLDAVTTGGKTLYDSRPGAPTPQVDMQQELTKDNLDQITQPTDKQMEDGIRLEDIPF